MLQTVNNNVRTVHLLVAFNIKRQSHNNSKASEALVVDMQS